MPIWPLIPASSPVPEPATTVQEADRPAPVAVAVCRYTKLPCRPLTRPVTRSIPT